MSEITDVQVNRITDAANKVSLASKNLVTAAREHKKGIIVAAACVTALALVGTTAYVVTQMTKPYYTPVHTNKKCKCEEEKEK